MKINEKPRMVSVEIINSMPQTTTKPNMITDFKQSNLS